MVLTGYSERKFHKYFFLSLALHLTIAVTLLFLRETKVLEMAEIKKKNLELIQASVRVDVVAMPEHTIKELKAMQKDILRAAPKQEAPVSEPKIESKPDVVEDDSPKLIKEVKKKSFAERMKELSQKKTATKTKKVDTKNLFDQSTSKPKEDSISNFARKELKDLVIQGNKLAKGSAITGSGNSQDMSRFAQYVSSLPDIVRPHWRLPSYLINKDLRCRIRVYLAKSGKLIRAEIYESSGVSEFDSKALEAVKSASPFPDLGSDIGKYGASGDILLGFPL